MNPINDFVVDKSSIQYLGESLHRPESVIADQNGTIWVSDDRGGVTQISSDGEQTHIMPKKLRPNSQTNGITFCDKNSIYVANFSGQCLEILSLDGYVETICSEIDGKPLGWVNHVQKDSKDRLWVSVSTKQNHWIDVANDPSIKDGYVFVFDDKGPRIVAEGFSLTNEVRFDAKEHYLYVVSTMERCIKRMRVNSDASLGEPEIFGPSDLGGYPDGITFDSYGNLWGTLIGAEQVFAITPDGDLKIVLDDGNQEAIQNIEQAISQGALTLELMASAASSISPLMTSIAFGGPDLKTVYIGNLIGQSIPYFRSPVAGAPPLF